MRDKIVDPLVASPDAQDILEEEEFDYVWKLRRPAIDWYQTTDGVSLNAEVIANRLLKIESARECIDRQLAIREWIADDHGYNIDEALDSSPLIALSDGSLIDGWHRLSVWLAKPSRKRPACIVGQIPHEDSI